MLEEYSNSFITPQNWINLHNKFSKVTPEQVSEDFHRNQVQQGVKQGYFTPEQAENMPLTPELRKEYAKMFTNTNTAALDSWRTGLDKLDIPPTTKFHLIKQVLGMSEYLPEHGYVPRTQNSERSFPFFNKRRVTAALNKMAEKRAKNPNSIPSFRKILNDVVFDERKKLQNQDEGQWYHFPQGTPGEHLYNWLKDKNTGWCIGQECRYANQYLNKGDFHIYATGDQPRVAYHPQESFRGLLPNQEVEPVLASVVNNFNPNNSIYYRNTPIADTANLQQSMVTPELLHYLSLGKIHENTAHHILTNNGFHRDNFIEEHYGEHAPNIKEQVINHIFENLRNGGNFIAEDEEGVNGGSVFRNLDLISYLYNNKPEQYKEFVQHFKNIAKKAEANRYDSLDDVDDDGPFTVQSRDPNDDQLRYSFGDPGNLETVYDPHPNSVTNLPGYSGFIIDALDRLGDWMPRAFENNRLDQMSTRDLDDYNRLALLHDVIPHSHMDVLDKIPMHRALMRDYLQEFFNADYSNLDKLERMWEGSPIGDFINHELHPEQKIRHYYKNNLEDLRKDVVQQLDNYFQLMPYERDSTHPEAPIMNMAYDTIQKLNNSDTDWTNENIRVYERARQIMEESLLDQLKEYVARKKEEAQQTQLNKSADNILTMLSSL